MNRNTGSNSLSPIPVRTVGRHPAVRFAGEELRRCLQIMTGRPVVLHEAAGFDSGVPGLWIGLSEAFAGLRPPPAVRDPAWDDALAISVRGTEGTMAGNNPRSTLLAAYRYLTELGCRWVRPGPDGEFVPRADLSTGAVEVCEAAAYRHRGVCLEGAVSEEHLRHMIEWLPRVGFNAFFVQFREGYTFFERWYSHRGNPFRKPEEFSVEKARDLVARAVPEIKKRDLLLHAVGHGWTCEPLGLHGLGWEYPPETAPEGVTPYLAQVNGKRALWQGIPLNTNLCYSNPEVQRLIVEDIARYAAAHPEVDLLHVWLADGSNNHCECPACRDVRPADFYVRMLNEADRRLTARGLPTRIAFLIYVDLLWPPEKERLLNPDRFVLMFAPISRTYSHPFRPEARSAPLPPYVRNRLAFPRNVEENVAFLREWQQRFAGDSFDFDYHFVWDHYADPGYTAVAAILHEDIRRLRDIGLNGYVSCQTQRACFPTGLGQVVLGRTLWGSRQTYDEMAADYYAAAFGADAAACREYLETLTRLFDPVYLRGEKPGEDARAAESLEAVPGVLAAFRPAIERNRASPDPCRAASWRYLAHHAEIAGALSRALALRARGNAAEARKRWEALARDVWRQEDVLHTVLDAREFVHVMGGRFPPPP